MSTTNCFALCPPDILLEIVHYSLPPLQDFKQRHIKFTSMRVVCQYWNTVITSTPQFWSTIQINFPSQTIPLPTIHKWLTRSSDASLNIFIKDRPPINWTDAEIQLRTDLMSAINLHISRCKSLQLEVTVGILPAFRLLRVSEAERLESLEINMRGNTDEHVHAHLIQQLSALSSLLHLSIATHVPHFITRLLHHCNPTWLSQLTCVRLSCPITTREMLALMEKCTSATQICLNQVLPSDPPTSPISAFSPSVTLKALTSLDISFTSSNTYLILLQRISFPNLKTLHLSGIDISDLSSTVHSLSPSLNFLKTRTTTQREIINEICTLLNHPTILRLPVLEIESREYESWTEYGGWNDINERPIREAVKDFNKSHAGFRMIRYNTFSEWYRGYFISWADSGFKDGNSTNTCNSSIDVVLGA